MQTISKVRIKQKICNFKAETLHSDLDQLITPTDVELTHQTQLYCTLKYDLFLVKSLAVNLNLSNKDYDLLQGTAYTPSPVPNT